MEQLLPADIEAKKNKFKRNATIAAIGATGLLVAPVILVAIGGLVGLAVAGAVGFTIVTLAPVFVTKVANAKYRMLDAEKVSHIKKVGAAAAENPIETLTALLMAKKVAFEDFRVAVEKAISARENFKTKVAKFKEKWPQRAAEFEIQLQRITERVEQKKAALKEAQRSLEEGDLKLEEMKAYYEMSKDLIEANLAAGMDTGDAFERLKSDTAVDAVFESMNLAFAQLEVASALEIDEVAQPAAPAAQLGHSEPVVLDVEIQQPAVVGVPRQGGRQGGLRSGITE